MKLLIAAPILLLVLGGCTHAKPAQEAPHSEQATEMGEFMAIPLTSVAFEPSAAIPSRYTCDGEDVSPALHWSGVPATAKSLALVCEDPDAPGKTWVHWVVYGIPALATDLVEAIPKNDSLASGGRQGTSDFKHLGYGGPCPPRGKPHRYFFHIYALDAELALDSGATREELDKAMAGHIVGRGDLMATYQKQ